MSSCARATQVDLSVPEGVCLFASETEGQSQCKAHAALYEARAERETMIWPLGIIELTAGAAVGAFQVTIGVLGSMYDFAAKTGGDLI